MSDFFFSSRRRHTRLQGDWSSDVCSSDLEGKWAIHPSQIALANEVFTPPAAEVERARRILDALDQAAREGRGAAQLRSEEQRLNSSHLVISYAVFCLKKKKKKNTIYQAVILIN